MTKSKKVEKSTKEIEKTQISINTDKVIVRNGYSIYFIDPKDEATVNELTNSGVIIGQAVITQQSLGDSADEIVIIAKA